MILSTAPELDTRLHTWSKSVHQPLEHLVNDALERSLEDWEDYTDALRICAEVDARRMRTYTLREIEEQLHELEG